MEAVGARLNFAVVWCTLAACGARSALYDGVPPGSGQDAGETPDAVSPSPDVDEPEADATLTPPPDASQEAGVDQGADLSDVRSSQGDASLPPAPDFAWYRLDETSGTTAHDSSPHHYDMTNLDGVAWNAGAVFDGATVCGSTTVGPALRSAPITMTAWVQAVSRTDETQNYHALTPFPPNALSGDAPSLGGFGLGLDVWADPPGGSGMGIETGENAAVAFHTVGTFQASVQYFTVLVVAPAQATLYVNGSPLAVVSANTPLVQSPAPLHLGCHNDDAQYGSKRFFKGRLRDARIYTRLLGADEIAQLFADGPR